MTVYDKGITQIYLPPTHEPYLPQLPSHKASPPFGWYSLCRPTKGWPGWVDLDGWSHIEINAPHRELNLDMVTHPSTNWARRRVTSLMTATPSAKCSVLSFIGIKFYDGSKWWIERVLCSTSKQFHILIMKKFRQRFQIAIITPSDGFRQISINFANKVSSQETAQSW